MSYTLQLAPKSFCPKCGESVALLCEEDPTGNLNLDDFTWFYICFKCEHVAQVGVGPVKDERHE